MIVYKKDEVLAKALAFNHFFQLYSSESRQIRYGEIEEKAMEYWRDYITQAKDINWSLKIMKDYN